MSEAGGLAPVRIALGNGGERGKAHLPSRQATVVHPSKLKSPPKGVLPAAMSSDVDWTMGVWSLNGDATQARCSVLPSGSSQAGRSKLGSLPVPDMRNPFIVKG